MPKDDFVWFLARSNSHRGTGVSRLVPAFTAKVLGEREKKRKGG